MKFELDFDKDEGSWSFDLFWLEGLPDGQPTGGMSMGGFKSRALAVDAALHFLRKFLNQ